jgi:mRNA-degrading endonuclease RelE of RelBE toxin-antitoxin system
MFNIVFSENAFEDLAVFRKSEQQLIVDNVGRHLTHQPLLSTRNRKPLRPNALSKWELRVGSYRIYYDVDELAGEVTIKAIGHKIHNALFVRGKECRP